jgi:hypothetical protein
MRGRMVSGRSVHGGWLAVALLTVFAVLGGCSPPVERSFVEWSEDQGDVGPGDVLSSRPWSFTQDVVHRTPAGGVRVEQVLYRSTDALGDPVDITGTVLLPTTPWPGPGPRPLVSYAVGTRGIGDDCAPSRSLALGIDYEGGLIVKLLARGWAVVVSDMEGLGTPGEHTYNVGRSQGRAVLDAARAALRFPDAGLAPDSPVGIVGYSQGGGSAGWAAQLADTYAPELRLVGVVAGGVPGDLRAVADEADGGPFVALVLLTSMGFDEAYPELRLESFVNDRGRELLEAGRRFCILSLEGLATVLDVANTWSDDYVASVNPLRTPEWQARLDENRLGGWAPSVPVLMHHGLFDQMVPFAQAERLRREWCAQGAPLFWRVFPLAEHVLGALLHGDPALAFLHDRFVGRPFSGNCADPIPL